ncbi:MAG: hypothetical protein EBU84_11195, partial [Actinobacteria bacterium]|nr:hypothetical protein [Actinomycetota bacterium]
FVDVLIVGLGRAVAQRSHALIPGRVDIVDGQYLFAASDGLLAIDEDARVVSRLGWGDAKGKDYAQG